MNQHKKQQQPIHVVVEAETPQKIGDQWQVLVTAIISQGKQAVEGQAVQFFLNGLSVGTSAQTDENGRVSLNVDIPLNLKSAAIEAQIIGQSFRARKMIALSKESKESGKQIPAELIVDPARVGNKINFLIRIIDEKKQGVKGSKITIVDSGQISTVNTDEDGEYIHKIRLQPNEEREIAIYAAGYGDRGFRRTFRGRRET